MFRILVPVDFYKTSYAAYNYAANFSQLFPNAEIILLHVINGSFNSNDVVTFDPMIGLENAAQKKLTFFHENYSDVIGIKLPVVKIKKEVRFGIPGFTIADYANYNEIDMVIMGTRDQHNLFDKILGSASAIAVRISKCPVMLIHENVKFNMPKKVVFAFDKKTNLNAALDNYGRLNAVINAKTDYVHVSSKKNENTEKQKAEIFKELFDNINPLYPFEIKSIQNEDVHNTLKDYCLFEKTDILIMVHRKEGLFNNIFKTHNSVRMAQEFHLPVLVFHEDIK